MHPDVFVDLGHGLETEWNISQSLCLILLLTDELNDFEHRPPVRIRDGADHFPVVAQGLGGPIQLDVYVRKHIMFANKVKAQPAGIPQHISSLAELYRTGSVR